MSTRSRAPRNRKTTTKTDRLIQMSVCVTEGELAFAVFIRPCTIHGCRPFSVNSQPAVFIRNGVTTDKTPSRTNHFERAREPLCTGQAPQNANSRRTLARQASTRVYPDTRKTIGTQFATSQ